MTALSEQILKVFISYIMLEINYLPLLHELMQQLFIVNHQSKHLLDEIIVLKLWIILIDDYLSVIKVNDSHNNLKSADWGIFNESCGLKFLAFVKFCYFIFHNLDSVPESCSDFKRIIDIACWLVELTFLLRFFWVFYRKQVSHNFAPSINRNLTVVC